MLKVFDAPFVMMRTTHRGADLCAAIKEVHSFPGVFLAYVKAFVALQAPNKPISTNCIQVAFAKLCMAEHQMVHTLRKPTLHRLRPLLICSRSSVFYPNRWLATCP